MVMKRSVGWVMLGLMWAGVALRMVFPVDTMHSDYPTALNLLLLFGVDIPFIMPPMLLVKAVFAPSQDWVYAASIAVYLLALSLLIHWFLIRRSRKNKNRFYFPARTVR